MYDDGTHGDERAGDAVYSTVVRLPDNTRRVNYRYYGDGIPEFEPPPNFPPSWANRVLRLADDSIGPVDLFGELFLMADNAHPNALGQQVIASGLAAEIERLASFRDFMQDSEP
jgi:lysophospholipase L1-like esterase